MADLLAMSSAVIDGAADAAGVGPINRINFELSEIGDGVAMVEAFSHSVLFETDDGLVAFDTSNPQGDRSWCRRSVNGAPIGSTPSCIRTGTSITSVVAGRSSRMRPTRMRRDRASAGTSTWRAGLTVTT